MADFKDDPNYMTFLNRIRKNVLNAMSNADGTYTSLDSELCLILALDIHMSEHSKFCITVPFHEVCEALKVVRSSSRTSVFQAMFALQVQTLFFEHVFFFSGISIPCTQSIISLPYAGERVA